MHNEHHNIILGLLITLPPPPSFGKLEPPKAFVTCVAHSFQTSIIDPTTKRERPLPDGHKVLQQLSIPGDELSCIPEPSTHKKKTCSTALWEKGRRYTWIKKKCWKQTGKSKILAAFSYMVRLKTRNLTYFKTLPLAVSVAYWRIPVSTTTIGQWSSSRKDCNSALCWTAKRWPVIWLRWLICFGSFWLAQFTPTRTANPSKTRCNNWRKTT